VNAEQQHTFIETETVRYVYQPMEALYIVLITTKNSNILEDLETLRLFAKVVPEYCKVLTESEICAHAFELILAFDEIIALGYRENVNLTQIRTFTEMDSHDENVYKMIKKNKEKEAKENAKRREKELTIQRRQQQKMGGKPTGFGGGGEMSISTSPTSSVPARDVTPVAMPTAPAPSADSRKPGRGMKLGGKAKTTDFVDALIAEGDLPAPATAPSSKSTAAAAAAPSAPSMPAANVHIKLDETITLSTSRDGGMENMEVKGTMLLSVNNPDTARVKIAFNKNDDENIAFTPHPNVDKKLLASENIIALKAADKPFPVGAEVGVMKWRFQTTDESHMPLTINCWPTVNSDGTVNVNIDYELINTNLELQNVVITIPLPAGGPAPIIGSCDGDYAVGSRNSVLEWRLSLVDSSNRTGAMEFSAHGRDANDFFPVVVNFSSPKTFAGVEIVSVTDVDSGADVSYATDAKLTTAKYQVV